MRYVLEGTWSGYTSGQRRVVHREIITSEKRAERLRTLYSIRYTDGTSLILNLREAKPREHVQTVNTYGDLIRECETQPGGTVLVANLPSTIKTSPNDGTATPIEGEPGDKGPSE